MTETQQEQLVIRIEGRDYDLLDLTLGEVDEIEEACGGVALEELNLGRAKVLMAFAYTMLKRDNPDVTMEDVRGIRRQSLWPANGAGAD